MILDRILATKRDEVDARAREMPLMDLRARAADAPPIRGFLGALRARDFSVIAELKRRSPAKGLLQGEPGPRVGSADL